MTAPEGKKRVNVYMDEELYAKISKETKRLGISMSAFFNIAGAQYLQMNSVMDLVSYLDKIQKGSTPPAG